VLTGQEADRVEGVIFTVAHSDIASLDAAERGYDRILTPVIVASGRSVDAETYQARTSNIDERLVPFDWYMGLIEAGAREHGFPEDYYDDLRKAARIPDSDVERRVRNQELLRQTYPLSL
jgi:hypothetical protein